MILYNPTVSGSLLVTGSLTTTGTITSQTLVVQTITSSIEFNTGSTRNGTLSTNTHEFTGSVSITGSAAALLNVNNGVLFVSASGNVGIGTTSPSEALHISRTGSSTVLLVETVSFNDAAIKLKDQSRSYYIGTSGGNYYIYDQNAALNRLVINSSGNVGIGTTSPSYSLHVSAATGTNVTPQINATNTTLNGYGVLRLTGNSRGGFIDFYDNTSAQASIVGQGGAFYVYTNGDSSGTPKLTVTAAGNVGIGTTNPATLSTLGGAVQFMGDYVNHQTIIKSAGTAGTVSGQLTITIPEMSNASVDGYGGYSCEVYLSAYLGIFCHVWFSGYNNSGITGGEVTILRSSGGFSVSQASTGTYNQGFQFVVNYPSCTHPAARIIFNKGGSPNATITPANSITAVFS
jgi:hypothetical protein